MLLVTKAIAVAGIAASTAGWVALQDQAGLQEQIHFSSGADKTPMLAPIKPEDQYVPPISVCATGCNIWTLLGSSSH
ncbi:MAG: hypothetical protein V4772_03030 [Pseudomonadota bacterium]